MYVVLHEPSYLTLGAVVSELRWSEFTDFIELIDISQITTCHWLSQRSGVAPSNRFFIIGQVDFFTVCHLVEMSVREV